MHLTPRILTSAAVAALITLASAAQAQSTAPQPPTQPQGPFSFFVTSVSSGQGANFGGLTGADAHCQKLATTVGAGDKTWRAYLSTQAIDGQAAVNARDRIGSGPWFNVKGGLIARSVSHLHGDVHEEARIGNALNWRSALTEKGDFVKRSGDTPNEHDIVTGSTPDGRAFPAEAGDRSCKNYTSSAEDGAVQVGHFDRTGGVATALSWNSAHPSLGCSLPKLQASGGAGFLYCFAAN